MFFSLSHELFVFLHSIFAGVLISIVFDIFRMIRKKVSIGVFLSSAQDIVFWIIATIIMFFVIYHTNNGAIRFYQFLGALFGSFLYFLSASRFVSLFLCRFIDVFCRISEFFLKILLTPLKFMYKLLCVVMYFAIFPAFRVLKKIFKNLFFSLRKNFKALKFIKNKK